MLRQLLGAHPLILLLCATTLEASGDAVLRLALFDHAGSARIGLLVAGAALLFGYGTLLNLAPIEFRRVIGLYIATLFVVWQVTNFVFFKSLPTLSIVVGGAFIIVGGAITTYWNPA